MRFAVFTTIAMSLAVSLQAQTGTVSGSRLIGLTSTTPLIVRQDPATCSKSFCAPAGFPSAAARFAGGTAYDARTRGVWISDGTEIAKVAVDDSFARCGYQCKPFPVPSGTAAAVVTGLAFDDIRGRLWVSMSTNDILVFDVHGCALRLVRRCAFPVASGHTVTGLATDDVGELLFVATSAWMGPSLTPGGIVYASKMSSACQPFCKHQVRVCQNSPLKPLTGLGYDACRDLLWVTDGDKVSGLKFDIPNCVLVEKKCCRMSLVTEGYVGLCVMPGRERSAGRSCTNGSCPTCPQLRHVLNGDPVLGNPEFALDLVDAPARARAWLVFNAGPCQPNGPLILPFCGPIMVPFQPLPPIVPAGVSTGGNTGCTGTASIPLPVGVDPALCGVEFSSQYIGLCTQPILGTFVSNCLTWTVRSN